MAHTHTHLPQSPAMDVALGPYTHLDFRFELVPLLAALPAGAFWNEGAAIAGKRDACRIRGIGTLRPHNQCRRCIACQLAAAQTF